MYYVRNCGITCNVLNAIHTKTEKEPTRARSFKLEHCSQNNVRIITENIQIKIT